MKPYSLDLRQRVVKAYENKEGSIRTIARRFKVSPNTVWAWVQHFRQVGSVEPKPHGGGGTPRIDTQGREKVRQLVTEQSDATLKELCERYEQHQGVRVSQATMCRTLQRLRLSRKKKTFWRFHSKKYLWMALALPNWAFGRAFHWMPVRRTKMIASKTWRGSIGLRPPPGRRRYRPPGGRFRLGMSGSTFAQSSSDTVHALMAPMAHVYHNRLGSTRLNYG